MNRRDRAALDDRGERGAMYAVQPGACPGGLRSIKPSGPWALNFRGGGGGGGGGGGNKPLKSPIRKNKR